MISITATNFFFFNGMTLAFFQKKKSGRVVLCTVISAEKCILLIIFNDLWGKQVFCAATINRTLLHFVSSLQGSI